MCDCFHMVLPTWPGAPGSVSGRQLQPEEPDAETEEDHCVTEGPVDEIIRPRPQGSSPVYECVTEGAGFGLPEHTPSRQGSSGRRRSWWKRDSGGSRTFSRMSRSEEETEVTLKTEVEAGASGYSVTGGGDQGIFVKQVLKDSSAAKLFSLREGDQLLSTTIFFDGISYEDALKILQYSEPYKVQFKIKRKLLARGDEEWAASAARRAPKRAGKLDKDGADGTIDTPVKTLERDGDQERLLSKPREGRGRRPQKERLSWPKFQGMRSRRGPRRSHSSSEAYESGKAPDASPTSSDTEAQFPAEEQELKAGTGGQRRRRFLSLRFKVGSGKGPRLVGHPGRAAQGGTVQAGDLEEAGSWDDSRQDTGAAVQGRREDGIADTQDGTPTLGMQEPTEQGRPCDGALGGGDGMAPRHRKKTKVGKVLEKTVLQGKARAGAAPGQSQPGHRHWVPGLEEGTGVLCLQDPADEASTQGRQPQFQTRMPTIKTPTFIISKEKVLGTEEGTILLELGPRQERPGTAMEKGARSPDAQRDTAPAVHLAGGQGARAQTGRAALREEGSKTGHRHMEGREGKTEMPEVKRPSCGWSAEKGAQSRAVTQGQETETQRHRHFTVVTLQMDPEGTEGREGRALEHRQQITAERERGQTTEGGISLGNMEVASKDSKFKMPKFKMPTFGTSTPSKSMEASVEGSLPKAQGEVSLSSMQADIKTSHLSTELPPADVDIKTGELAVKLTEGDLSEREILGPAAGGGPKSHLPKVQMPSMKMPKVDFKGPQVDIKGPKLDHKGAKGEVPVPEVDVSMPSVEVDIKAPGAKLEVDMGLGDTEVAARDSKFKMPKFKMPSFGLSVPDKDLGTSVDVPVPRATREASVPSLRGEMPAAQGSVQIPAGEIELPGGDLEVALPEGEVTLGELKGKAEVARFKGHLPKVQMPKIKVPREDIKSPQVDTKGPKLDLKGTKGEATVPEVDVSMPSVEVDIQVPDAKLDVDMGLRDTEVASRDSKFKMPKFKMPSFGASVPSKSMEASMDVSLPKAEGEVSLPSIEADIKTSELSTELPSADVEVKTGELTMKLPEGHLLEVELHGHAAKAGVKGHLPKVHMPTMKMPKVDVKGPQVDIKGPKLDLKGPKGEVTVPEVDVSMPRVEVDIQEPGSKLEVELGVGDMEVTSRDSRFKMPKFKMPSFGASVPSKSMEASVDVSLPKAKGEVSLPSIQADIKTSHLSTELPSADVEVKTGELSVKLPEGHLPEVELHGHAAKAGVKGHLPKVHIPSMKMPKVDFKGPQADIKGPKLDLKDAIGEVPVPEVDVSIPSMEVDIQAPGAKLEVDTGLRDTEVAARDSKFKMPKFKMPSFGMSAPDKDLGTSVDLPVPSETRETSVPSLRGEMPATQGSVPLPSGEIELPGGDLEVVLPEGEVMLGELKGKAEVARFKSHLPKMQMPKIKVPREDIKSPQVDIKGPQFDLKGTKGEVTVPEVDVLMPSMEVDIQVPGGKLEVDMGLGDTGGDSRDSKFKMPKFKMPSFSVSVPSKSLESSLDVSLQKAQREVSLPSIESDIKSNELSTELPSADMDVKTGELTMKLPEGQLPEVKLHGPAAKTGLKGHLPKVHMPSMKMPTVDFKGPQVDIKGPKMDQQGTIGEVTIPEMDVSMPSMKVDIQAPDAKLEGDISLGDKEVASRDSKFKMPKFKMPSFGTSAPSKSMEASMDVSLPKADGEVSLPSIEADMKTSELSTDLPSADVEVKTGELTVKLPEGHLPDIEVHGPAAKTDIQGHLPKVHMPSMKMPKVDFKGPQVDIKGPKLDLKGPKGSMTIPEVDVSMSSVEVDIQAPDAKLEGDISLEDKKVASKDSKFKMPKFKMPSFGASVPSKSMEASMDVSLPKAEADVSLPSIKTSDLSTELPSADVDVKTGELSVRFPEGHLPEVELHRPATKTGLKGHLPKVHMPTMKMPTVDFKGPQVDIKGPKMDQQGTIGEVTIPEMDVSMPSMKVDIQAPDAKLEGDISLGDKEVASRDSKFKMPKFQMPSFGTSVPSKSMEASMDVSLPKADGEVSLPSIEADMKTSELSTDLPSADVEVKTGELTVKLPEGHLPDIEVHGPAAKTDIQGHLPKVHMPSMKMPKVDFKGPQVDIKGPKLDLKGPKGSMTIPEVDVSMPSVEVDIQAPDAKLEGDISLEDKKVASKDSKFKMPKFKMPSFGASVPSKSMEASMDVSLPKAEADVSLPSIKTSDLSTELPSADVDVKTGELSVRFPEGHLPEVELHRPATKTGLKGHLPKVHMPTMKMPTVDFKGPQVDIKGPKMDQQGTIGEVTIPEMDVSMPSMKVDIQAPDAKLEGDISLGDKEVASRDSKFKMPKFQMPSFGTSVPSKSMEASMDVSLPKADGEVSLPSIEADMKTSELSTDLPSADVEVKTGELTVKLPEGHLPDIEVHGPAATTDIQGHLPKVHMPSMKMPKVDFKGPQVDIKGPKLDLKGPKGSMTIPEVDVSMPSVEVDIQAPDAKLEGDISLEDKKVASKDSKFKMPKFKMPSFGASVPSKSMEASMDVSLPKAEADVSLPSIKTSDLSTEPPSADVDVKTGDVSVRLPEGHLPEVELHRPATKTGLKGHLSKVHMPSMKMPTVDFKGPQVNIKGPKLDQQGTIAEMTIPEMDVSMPSMKVDIQAQDTKLEGDISLGDKEVASRDSKFKMPKFKMPSFGTSVPSKSLEASMDLSLRKAEQEVSLPSIEADMKTSELSTDLPSADVEVKTGELTVKLPEGHLPDIEVHGPAAKTDIQGHLPKVHMPSMKMPKVDFKGPQVDIKGPKLDLKGLKGEMTVPEVDVSVPSVEVDIQAPDAKLEGDISLGDKEVASRDSKFKILSLGASVPSKSMEASMDISLPKADGEVSLPSIESDVKPRELSTDLPSADVEVKTGELTVKLLEGHLPDVDLHGPAAKTDIQGHLPKVHMPSMKMPKVDFKGPQVDIKGPKLDMKGLKGEMTVPEVDVSMPSVDVDIQAPDTKLEGDLSLGDKEVAARDSKYKMPKFQSPSFGASVPSKSMEASADVSLPKAMVDVSLPTIKTSELSTELPSADMDVKTGDLSVRLPEGHLLEVELHGPAAKAGVKGHLPKVHMPSMKMPKVEFKGPQVDIKGPKLDLKGSKGDVTVPEVDVSMPSVEVDSQAPEAKLEGDISLGEKEVASRDSKLKMTSFGVSVPSKSMEASMDVSMPTAKAEVSLPSFKTRELSIELQSADMDVKTGEFSIKLPEGHLPEVEHKGPAAESGVKEHLPKVHMPSMKMPKVDFKGLQVDIKGPKLDLKCPKVEVTVPEVDVSMPSVDVDIQAPDAKIESDISLPDKEVAYRDSKFKMPKFKMPSFGASEPSKSVEASMDVSMPKAEGKVSLPSIESDIKTRELSTELPSADVEGDTGEPTVKLPEGHLPEVEFHGPAAKTDIQGHLPKVHMPSMKIPKVEFKGPQVDIKGPKLDMKGPKGEVTVLEVDVSMPSEEVDIQTLDAKLECDISLGHKEVASRDSKFKMPKFKMPSFGASVPSKSMEASMDVSLPNAEAEVSLPSIKTSNLSTELPSADVEVKTGELSVRLPEGHLPEVELHRPATKTGLKGHLPKVHMPSMKMPTIDFKGPQVDIKGPKLDQQGTIGEVTIPEVDVSMPSMKVDIQAPDAKLEGDISLGEKEVASKDSKFKMPKFKMPSFGASVPSKSMEASMDVSLPKADGEVSRPSIEADMKTSELSTDLPSADVEVKTGKLTVKLPEGHLPEVELHGHAANTDIQGHLPKVHIPSMKMPNVDFKGPRVDIKGPKLDLKAPKGDVTIPEVDVSMPSVEVDSQSPEAKLDGDISLGDKEVASRDSKFKMPKFKMPSFGVSVPSKSMEASLDVSMSTAEAEVSLPSFKTRELSTELPSADMDVKTGEISMKLQEGHLPEVELHGPVAKGGVKGHLPKVHMPSMKMPTVDIKGPQVDIKGPKLDLKSPKGEVTVPEMDVSMPSVNMDIQGADAKLEGDISLGEKEVASRDSKLKMPKFKMPSFGASVPSKSMEASMDVSLLKAEVEVSLPSIKTSNLSTELPSADVDVKTAELSVRLPEGHLPDVELHRPATKTGLKGHLPKVHMPTMKMPTVDFKGPQVDIQGPKLDQQGTIEEVTIPEVDVSMPSMKVDIQASEAKLEGDISLGDKEVASRDSKFKMPKFKMPSFGASVPSKSMEASMDVSLRKAEGEVSLPSIEADMKTSELSTDLPSADVEVKTGELTVKLPEGHLPDVELHGTAAKTDIQRHLPKVHLPSMKMPKVDFKGPQVDIKGPKLDLKGLKGEVTIPEGEVTIPEGDVSVPSMEVDIQAPDSKLDGDLSLSDKVVPSRDSKFKMPKFKMPSFGASVPSKSMEASADVSLPKAEVEVSLPTKTSQLSTELPSADMDVKTGDLSVRLLEGHIPDVELHGAAAKAGLKGHLPKVHMPSMKMPKVEFKGPQVDIKGPKLDLKGPKGDVTVPEVDVSMPSVELDSQAQVAKLEGDISLGAKEVAPRDSKFKMPKFKMPSFDVSVPSKSMEASMDITMPTAEAEVSLPSFKTRELSTELPSADMDVKTGEISMKLQEGHLPEVELHGTATKGGVKGHLPKVHMPSMKMPKVDFKGPQVDIKGPKLDLKSPKGEVTVPKVDVSIPSVELDIQGADTELEGDISLGAKEVASRDSKFKMPKFKMPSFGTSVPSKSMEASMDITMPTAEAEVSLPSFKTRELSTELPSADMDVKTGEISMKLQEGHLPEVELHGTATKGGVKGHLPKVHMPSMKMPKVDFKGPQVDIKGPKLDLKSPKGEVTVPEVDVSIPSVELDIQGADTKLEGDISLGAKEVASRDSKFKMPKFKMPSFSTSVPSKSMEASMDVSLRKADGEVSLPPTKADMKTSKLSTDLPSADVDVKSGELSVSLPEGHLPEVELHQPATKTGLKVHLPKVHMPSMKMPKVDFKGPHVDIKGHKLDKQGTIGEVTVPEVDVSMPSMKVDIQGRDAKLEDDISLGDKEVASSDSKFKMPKFKMPSFGTSVTSKSMEASMDVSLPKAEGEVSLPSIKAGMKTNELSTDLPSADVEVKTGELTVKLPEDQIPEVELHGPTSKTDIQGHLPKVHMPSMKMPKVDFKGPRVDIKGPKLDLKGLKGEVTIPEVDVSMPSLEVDIQAPDAKLEGDISLGDKEVASRDSKFKMPKFKMPSFGASVPSKSMEASMDMSLPKAEAEVSLPSIKTSNLSTELPSADVDVKTGELSVRLPEGHLPEEELHRPSTKTGLKGHLPKVHMPSMKMPKVDFHGPHVDIKGPKLDQQGTIGEVTVPEVDVSMPSMKVDIQAPDAMLEGDISLGDKEVTSRDSKFKMPKFKMPSFGASVPSKSMEASMDVSLRKAEQEVSLPSIEADMKTSELSTDLPSADVEVKTGKLTVKLPEGHLPEVELHGPAVKTDIQGHLPKVHMPSMKMPKVDFKGPRVDIKGPKLDLKGLKGEVTAPEVDVSMPSVEVDIQAPDAKLEGDISLGDKEVASRDSKFKMPKFKMPSFGASVPSKSMEASAYVSLPKAEVEVSLPTKTRELSTELPSADMDVKTGDLSVRLPEGHLLEVELHGPAAKAGVKGHLPKVHMPSMKMPKVEFKGPQVDIKGPKLDLKGPKGDVTVPEVDVSMPSMEVDSQAPVAKLEGDISLGDKEVASRDSKFKMPKFKMPSFGTSVPSKSMEASMDVSMPTAEAEVSLPSIKTRELSTELPSADMDVKTGEFSINLPEGHLPEVELHGPATKAGVKGNLPKVHMPSMKMPKVDFRGPQVDIKGSKLDLKGPKGDVTIPEVDVSMPRVEVDMHAPDAKLESDISLPSKKVASRYSKFKMPTFKMPSFGASAPRKSMEASMDVSLPMAEGEVSLPFIEGDIKTRELSTELPSAEAVVKTGELTVKLPEGHLPEVELHGPAAKTDIQGHLPKVHMPSMKIPKVDFKGPQVDIKDPKLDLKGLKGEVNVPEVDVSMPSVEVDIQAPYAKLEGDISLWDKEVVSRDSKFKMPKVSMSFFGSSSCGSYVVSPHIHGSGPAADASSCSHSADGAVHAADHSASIITVGGASSAAKSAEQSIVKPHFKISKVFPPPGPCPTGLGSPDGHPGGPLPGSDPLTLSGVDASVSLGEPCAAVERSVQVPPPGWPSASSAWLDVSGHHAESSAVAFCEGVTLTKYQVTLPRATVCPELPQETLSECQGDAHLFSTQRAATLPSWESAPLSQTDSHPGPADPLIYTSYGRVTFPKFHGPKFRFSVSEAAEAKEEPCALGGALSSPGPAGVLDSEEAAVFPQSGTQLPSAGVSLSQGTGGPIGRAGQPAMVPAGGEAEDTDRDGKGSPLKMPRLRLPGFRRSPKKGAERKEDPAHSLAVDAGMPGVHVLHMEAHMDVTPEKDGEKGRVKTPGFAVSHGPPRDSEHAVSSAPHATAGASGEGAAGVASGFPEEAGENLHLPQVHLPTVGFAKPGLRPSQVQGEVSQSAGSLPLPKHGLSLGDGREERELGEGSASQPPGAALSTEDPLQAACGTPDPAAPAVRSPERDSAAGAEPASSQDSWFRMPSFRLPSFWRSSKERGGAGGLGTPSKGEVPTAVHSPGVCAPGSEVEADAAEVLRRSLDGKGLELHLPPAGTPPDDLPTSKARLCPGESSLPLQMPRERLSETQAPPGETSKTPASGAGSAEHPSCPPEGPFRLKASLADMPAQTSAVDRCQVWEDSVLTVKFPRLKVPRFTFPAPSCEADIFVPAVREVWCPDSSLDLALCKDSPGAWGVSVLKAGAGVPGQQPVALDLSSDASPISKVKVHIHGARVESQEVTIHSRVTTEFADLSEPETFSTQIVRESEVPASKIQTPSYGFSLLKGRVLESPVQAQVQVVTQDCQLPEGFQVASKQVTLGAASVSGALQPCTGEPFEMISSSVHVLGPQAFTSGVCSGPQLADSCSDEEPAEILEFPPEDGGDEDRAAKEKTESKRSSGPFRFWLPSIGFSSSAEDTSTDFTQEEQTPAPVQTQPEARPEAELPKKQEKAGWFRFPKLGFSSSPSKTSESTGDQARLAEPKLQEEAVTFFDAQESLSAEEDGEHAEAAGARPGPCAMVTSAARTELAGLEQGRKAGAEPAPRPATK